MTSRNNFFSAKQVVVIFLLLSPLFLSGQELFNAPTANYTEVGVPRAQLVLVKDIPANFEKGLFFAKPRFIAAGDNGLFYVYDSGLKKVLVFDNQFQRIGECLSNGAGQGDVQQAHNIEINVGQDGCVYVCDGIGDKIIQFSPTLKFIKEFKMNRRQITPKAFRPVVDMDGSFYFPSLTTGIVDKMDQKLSQVTHSYLDVNLNNNFLIFKPNLEQKYKGLPNPKNSLFADSWNTSYDITSDGQLFIYLHRSSTAFIINKEDKKVVKKFDILIDRVLAQYQKNIEEMLAKDQKNKPGKVSNFQLPMFYPCFVDKDEPYFYLQQNGGDCVIYQFDLSGKLRRIIDAGGRRAVIMAKKNGLFYGLSLPERNPIIFK